MPVDLSSLPTAPAAGDAAHTTHHGILDTYARLYDAAGDLIVGSGADAADKLAKGSAGTRLAVKMDGSGLEWSGFRGTRVYATVSQTIAGAWASIAFNNETVDTDGFHDNVTNNNRLTVPAGMGGKYLVASCISYQLNSTGGRFISLLSNAVTRTDLIAVNAVSGSFRSRVSTVAVMLLAAGDYVEIQGYQDSGTALQVGDTTASGVAGETWAAMYYLGA